MYNDNNFNNQNDNMGFQPDNSYPMNNQGFDNQNYNQGFGNYNQGYDNQAGYNSQPAMYDQQQDYSGQMYNTGYDNQGYNTQAGYDSQPAYGVPEQTFDNNDTSFQPPQSNGKFKPQATDHSGTIFLIFFLIVCGAIGFGIYKFWPQINANMKLHNTWECTEGVTVTFNNDDVIETNTSFLGTQIKLTGNYSIKKTEISAQNKKLTKDGYYYFNIKGKFTQQAYLSKIEDYEEDFELAFGIKGNEAHLIIDGESATCKKK